MIRVVFQLFLKYNLNVPSSHVLPLQDEGSGKATGINPFIFIFFHFSAFLSCSINAQHLLALCGCMFSRLCSPSCQGELSERAQVEEIQLLQVLILDR